MELSHRILPRLIEGEKVGKVAIRGSRAILSRIRSHPIAFTLLALIAGGAVPIIIGRLSVRRR